MKINKLFQGLTYLMILIWMIYPDGLFFKLIVILFIVAVTIENPLFTQEKEGVKA